MQASKTPRSRPTCVRPGYGIDELKFHEALEHLNALSEKMKSKPPSDRLQAGSLNPIIRSMAQNAAAAIQFQIELRSR